MPIPSCLYPPHIPHLFTNMIHFFSISIDKGTIWDRVHQTLADLGQEISLPSHVDLRPKLDEAGIEVYTQGQLNSCTANAICTIWRHAQHPVHPGWKPSRLFVYYNERSAEGTVSADSGANISDGCKSLVTFGVCAEETWPYVEGEEADPPHKRAYDEALDHQIHTPCQLPSHHHSVLKDSLVQSKPFIVGIALYDDFMGEHTGRTGIVAMPGPDSKLHGYHAVTCVGYDDHRRHWIFRNSWGPNWGDRGHFYLPYGYLDNEDNLASDFWNITTDWDES